MRSAWQYIIPVAALLGLTSCGEEDAPPRKCLPFYGGNIILEPEVFNFNEIKSYNGIAFTPNGCVLYISQKIDGAAEILRTEWVNGFWVEPELVRAVSSPYDDDHPSFSADGKRLYFNSSRPLPNGVAQEGLTKIWYVEQGVTGWSGPHYLEGVNSDDPAVRDGYAAPLPDGSLYFRSTRASGNPKNGDIFFAKFNGTGFNEPVLVRGVSSPRDEIDMAVTQDDRIMVISRYTDNPEDTYLMVSIKTGNGWGIPRAVEKPASQFNMELTPTVSPDGVYFLYEVRGVTFIVDLHALLTNTELEKLGQIRRGTEEGR